MTAHGKSVCIALCSAPDKMFLCKYTDYSTIEIFEPCERFLSGFDKNLWQASKIFFRRNNGEIILIPTSPILLGNPLLLIRPPQTITPVLLPRGGGRGQNGHGCAEAAMVDVLADVAVVDEVVPSLPSSPCLLPCLLDNDATVFVVVVVGPCRQDRGGGEEATTPTNAPTTAHGGKVHSGNRRVLSPPPQL
jgi:hypothetical protein